MRVKTDAYGNAYLTDVNFTASMSSSSSCYCSGCHKVAKVIKLNFLRTLYGPPSYTKLETFYSERWYCMDCLDKLRNAIKMALVANPLKEGENG